VRRFLSALAALVAVVVILVVEGGKLVLRTVRAIVAPVPETPRAEAELAAAIAEPVPATGPRPHTPAEEWGQAALCHLAPMGPEDAHRAACLDDAAVAYLDALDLDERQRLARNSISDIGAHLLGDRALPGLPRVPSPAEYRDAEVTRTAAALAEARRENAVREQHQHVLAILDDLIADEDPPLRRAA
jgi:hypothetical protein